MRSTLNFSHKKDYLKQIIDSENKQIRKLNELVSNAISEEKLLTLYTHENIDFSASFGEKVADTVASFGGSWKFIILFAILISVWIVLNSALLLFKPFDPYPYILLNLILSCVAAIQAPVIMMSQNRKEDRDRKRAESDYLVNLKAEIEIRTLHQKLDMLVLVKLENLLTIQKEQLDLLNRIKEKK